MKNIAIFCGASSGMLPEYTELAEQLGQLLVQQQIGLIYGGGKVGLMGKIADAVLRAGGKAIGVIPQFLVDKEVAHQGLSELHVVTSLHERKALIGELCDGYIAMPGGAGTLEEFFEVWTWGQLGLHRKPIGLLNVAKYYDLLVQFIKDMVRQDFLKQWYVDYLIVENDPEKMIAQFKTYQPPTMSRWVNDKKL